ncbi:hypothetical protein POM88_022987 [Heracleum sosnowskyi]|uniref:Ubiquitin-like protease family profile domain-containing protein n=1 Tax=Heracleum sosnowskyi TaxID=360622 RepID=A0AAD8IG39_9APIA|nr:hypothetical protein POM88_022987 [Heracleum sosnowskyi]
MPCGARDHQINMEKWRGRSGQYFYVLRCGGGSRRCVNEGDDRRGDRERERDAGCVCEEMTWDDVIAHLGNALPQMRNTFWIRKTKSDTLLIVGCMQMAHLKDNLRSNDKVRQNGTITNDLVTKAERRSKWKNDPSLQQEDDDFVEKTVVTKGNSGRDANFDHSKRKRCMSEKEDNNSRDHLDNQSSKRKVVVESQKVKDKKAPKRTKSDVKHTLLVRWLSAEHVPGWEKIRDLNPEFVRMEWQTKDNSADCGIFVMRHLETYMGGNKWSSDFPLKALSRILIWRN